MNFNLINFLEKKNLWSDATFGKGQRVEGIVKHIESELREIRLVPYDLMEWIDVVLLAFDGAYRSGYTAEEICQALQIKQEVNTKRNWGIPNPDKPSFHKKD